MMDELAPYDKYRCIIYSQDSIWTGDSKGNILIWNVKVPFYTFFKSWPNIQNFNVSTRIQQAHNGGVTSLIQDSVDKRKIRIFSCGKDNIIRIWDPDVLFTIPHIFLDSNLSQRFKICKRNNNDHGSSDKTTLEHTF